MIFLFIAFGYLCGTIPFGLLLSKAAGYGDIRKIGSGNIGATNVLRTGNKKLAALTLFLDGFKGAAPVLLLDFTGMADHVMLLAAGLAAVLGHNFPIWLKFKGGKGVATTLGVLLAAVPYAGLAACVTWLGMAVVFRYSSLSALVAILVAPIVTFFVYGASPALVCLLFTALLWWRHKDNIKRLLKGEEPKIGKRKE